MFVYYYFIKILFFFGLVRSQIKFDTLSDRYIFLGSLYTSGVAFLSWAFLMAPQPSPDWTEWQLFLGRTFLLSTFYFWLLSRFGEGFFFVVLLFAGIAVAYF